MFFCKVFNETNEFYEKNFRETNFKKFVKQIKTDLLNKIS